MISRTVYIGNPASLYLRRGQMVIEPEEEPAVVPHRKKPTPPSVPIEDLGYLIIDEPQVTVSHALLAELVKNNVVVVSCDERHMPTGLLLPLEGHTLQQERYRNQLRATEPLKKQLWKQTIECKIWNQARMLQWIKEPNGDRLMKMAPQVKSGDAGNMEARAAVIYWETIMADWDIRDRFGEPPNNMLNYGYAVLRATMARALVTSGLLCTVGIHHRNRYNAYCLADDIMEPYRPMVDKTVWALCARHEDLPENLSWEHKSELLSMHQMDVSIGGKARPLMVAVSETAASLAKCFDGTAKKIQYPLLV